MSLQTEHHAVPVRGPSAVLYDRNDARRFLRDRRTAEKILALSPSCRAELAGSTSIPVLGTSSVYGDWHHMLTLARVRRFERDFLESLQKEEKFLGTAVALSIRGRIHLWASFSCRLWYTLRGVPGPWVFLHRDRWEECAGLEETHAMLMDKMLAECATLAAPPPFGAVARFLNRLAARVGRRRRNFLVTAFEYGLTNISRKLVQADKELAVFHIGNTKGSFGDLVRPLATIWRALRGERLLRLDAVPVFVPGIRERLDSLVSGVKDPVIGRMIAVLKAREFFRNYVWLRGSYPDMGSLLKILSPEILISHGLRWNAEAVAGEAAKKTGCRTVMISHGSHSVPDSPASACEMRDHTLGLLVSPLADECILQSPHAEKAFQYFGGGSLSRRSRPIMWGYKKIERTVETGGNSAFRILHAGRFKTWTEHRPWIYETSDEFVHGLEWIMRELKGLDGLRLTIRHPDTLECDNDTLRRLVPPQANCSIDNSGDFLDCLKNTDLLMSYASTTIEEVVHARIPVLLVGGSLRYRHVPSRTVFPSPEDRGAVYALERREDLRPMIENIIRAHRGRPLRDDEMAGHVWAEKTPDIRELFAETPPA